MRRVRVFGLVLSGLIIFSLVFAAPIHAQTNNNNSLLNTLKALLQNIIGPVEKKLALVEDRVKDLEVWTKNHQDQPQCATCTAEIAVKAVNEEVAIDSLRSIHLAQAKFKKDDSDENGVFDYAPVMDLLFSNGSLIDNVLGTGEKRGYVFDLNTNQNIGWYVKASPKKPGKTGDRYFYCDESGVIRFETAHEASASSEPIGG